MILLLFFPLQVSAAPREEVLRLVPADIGLCLVVADLPAHLDKVARASWFKELGESPLGKMLAASKEAAKLKKFQEDLPRALGTDWARLRDDIFGDVIVFAHRAGSPQRPDEEEGLLLLRARQAEVLLQVLDRLNKEQKRAGELLELTELTHQGTRYFRRSERSKTNYYWLNGPLLAFANKEELIRGVIDRHLSSSAEPSLLGKHLRQAGADQAPVALWVNPRAVEPELRNKAKTSSAIEAAGLNAFLRYWQACDAVVLGLALGESLEARLTLIVRTNEWPQAGRRFFQAAGQPGDVWQRFPPGAIFRLAGQLDAVALTEVVAEFTPPAVRQKTADAVQRALGAALGLDPANDLLPQLGPNWGVCVAPAAKAVDFPYVLVVLGVKPGKAENPVDQTLVRAIQFFVGLALFDYNRKNPDPIRLKTVKQDNIEVKYLENDKVFPSGFQPALALKAGYLVLASSPEAIRQFGGEPITSTATESPFLHISLSELARWARGRREQVVQFLAEKNHLTPAQAGQNLDNLLHLADLADQLSLSHRAADNQLTWILRLGKGEVKK